MHTPTLRLVSGRQPAAAIKLLTQEIKTSPQLAAPATAALSYLTSGQIQPPDTFAGYRSALFLLEFIEPGFGRDAHERLSGRESLPLLYKGEDVQISRLEQQFVRTGTQLHRAQQTLQCKPYRVHELPATAETPFDSLGDCLNEKLDHPISMARVRTNRAGVIDTVVGENCQLTEHPHALLFDIADEPSFVWEQTAPWTLPFSAGRAAINRDAVSSSEEAVVVTRGGEGNHAHRLWNKLPLLVAAEEISGERPIFLTEHLTEIDRQLLTLLGVSSSKFTYSGPTGMRARYAAAPELESSRLHLVEALNSRPRPASKGELLYVSRRNSPQRPMQNEQSLERELESRGFRLIHAEDLTLTQQIEEFSHARAIVGPHGAGLVNSLFSPPGCAVIELLPPHYRFDMFEKMADMCGHEQIYIAGTRPESPISDAWSCDLDLTLSTIDDVLS